MSVGRQIRKAREAAGLTQRELAGLLGVTPSAVANYENDVSHPRESVFVALFAALGVDANYIYEEAPKLPPEASAVMRKYLELDWHGRRVVEAVLELELGRMKDRN